MTNEVMLEACDIYKSFGNTKALKGVSFSINKGEIIGLIGENGSGKSTFCSVLCGIHPRDDGKFIFDGQPFTAADNIVAQDAGISMIVQEMGTVPTTTVAENIFMGKERLFTDKLGFVSKKKMNKAAKEALEKIGADDIAPASPIAALNFEDRKLVEVARAMYTDPKLLIVDETTTALSQKGRDIIYSLIKKQAEEQKSVIFITHDLEELMSVCTRIVVLRDGEYIGTRSKEEFQEDEIKKMMVGREIAENYYRSDYDGSFGEKVVLKAENLHGADSLKGVSLELHEGEILGIGGLTDSGMHDLGRMLFGFEKPLIGKVSLEDGTEVSSSNVAVRNRLGYVSKNRDQESLMAKATINNNISVSSIKDYLKLVLIQRRKLTKMAKEAAKEMSVKCQSVEDRVSSLSGGNKQKVVFAKWLACNSKILILDCPTRGIDIGVKADMYALMYQIKKEGNSIILISEEMPEVIGMSDRILIFKDGEITGEFTRSESLSEHDLVQAMI